MGILKRMLTNKSTALRGGATTKGAIYGRQSAPFNRRKTGRNGEAAVCHLFQNGEGNPKAADEYFSKFAKQDEAKRKLLEQGKITESEYNTLLAEIRQKAALVNQLYNGGITIDVVPAEWHEEIQRRVDEKISLEGEVSEQEISSEEFYSMLEEVL